MSTHSGQTTTRLFDVGAIISDFEKILHESGKIEFSIIHDCLERVPEEERDDLLVDLVGVHLRQSWEREDGHYLLEDYVSEFGKEFAEFRTKNDLPIDLIVSEFLARHSTIQFGDHPDPLEYQGRFPDRDEISAAVRPVCFDDFRYVRLKIQGEGGLGRVWLAYDRHLQREVAIKEPNPAVALNKQTLEMMSQEARFTAALDHPAIVSIHELMDADSARPFYVMPLIKGSTLKELIDRYHAGLRGDEKDAAQDRSLSSRMLQNRLLNSFITICDAVSHAHFRGIVHRDLKPQNVIVGDFGETTVLDWGLAKYIAADSPDWSPTSNEELDESLKPAAEVDTPRILASLKTSGTKKAGTYLYMAYGQYEKGIANERTDVWSLGAILYQILTGEVPHVYNDDRQIVERKIPRLEEKLVPPHRLIVGKKTQHRVPKSLEAVCLKAMAAHPQNRFGSVRELADDLQRFLADEPLRTHRESMVARLKRWGRKHPAVVASVSVLLVTTVIALAISNVFIANEESKTRKALDEKVIALGEKDQALKETLETIDKYVETVQNAELLKEERFKPLLKDLLKDALGHYMRFIEEHEHDDETLVGLSNAVFQVAWMSARSGNIEKAIEAYRKTIDIREKHVEEHPTVTKYQNALANSYNNIGILYDNTRQKDAALTSYMKAIEIRKKLVEENPTVTEYRSSLAGNHLNIGFLYRNIGKWDDALASYRKAITIQEKLVEENLTIPEYRNDLAQIQINLGILHNSTGHQNEALVSYRKAIEIQENVVEENPSTTEYRNILSKGYHNVGKLYRTMNKSDEALISFRNALEIREKLVEDNPTVTEYLDLLSTTYNSIGILYRMMNKTDAALVSYQKSLKLRKKLVVENPDVNRYKSDLASSFYNFGNLYRITKQFDQALMSYREALKIQEKLVKQNPKVTDYEIDQTKTVGNIGILFRMMGKSDTALNSYRRAMKNYEKLVEENPNSVQLAISLGGSYINTASLARSQEDYEIAAKYYELGTNMLWKVVKSNPRHPTAREFLRNAHWGKALLKQNLGKYNAAVTDWEKAIEFDSGTAKAQLKQYRDAAAAKAKLQKQERKTKKQTVIKKKNSQKTSKPQSFP